MASRKIAPALSPSVYRRFGASLSAAGVSRPTRKKVRHPPADALHIPADALHIMDARGFRAARIPANIPSISAPAWFVSIGSVAGMPGVIARGSLKGYRELKADRRNRIQPGLCSPLAVHGASGLGGVGVLLEGRDLGVAQAPDVGELGVERSPGRLVSGLVVAKHHEGVAGVEELGGEGLEVIPFGGEAEEDALCNGGMADVGIAVGVKEVLRFVPDNGGIHAGEDSRAVATGEGCVEASDEIDVRLGHGMGLRYLEAVYRKTVPIDFPRREFLFLDPAPPRKKPAPQIRGELNRVAVSAARCVGQPSTPA